MFRLKNITGGKLETLLGAVLILAAILSVFMGKADWTSAGIAIGLGTTLLFTKVNSGTGAGIVALLLFCACNKAVITKSIIKDSTITIERIVKDTVLVPGDSVRLLITAPCPQLAGKTYKAKSKQAVVSVQYNNKGNAVIDCDCTPYEHAFSKLEREKTIWRSKEDTYVQEINKPWPWYVKWALGYTLFSIGVLVGYLIFKIIKIVY